MRVFGLTDSPNYQKIFNTKSLIPHLPSLIPHPSSLISQLQMYRLTIRHFNSILHAFTDSWMRMNRIEHFMMSCLELATQNSLHNYFSYIITDHVSTEPFAVLRIEDHFHKTFGMTSS